MLTTVSGDVIYPIGMGTMGLSGIYLPVLSRLDAVNVLKYAIDTGYNFIDSALIYGNGENGQSESIIAEALSQASKSRQSIFLSSKGGLSFVNGVFTISGKPKHLALDFASTLENLGTDYLDVYFLHRLDPETPLEDSLLFLAELKHQGKIRHIGISEVCANEIILANRILKSVNTKLDFVQNEYSIINRDDEKNEVFRICHEQDIIYTAYSPIGRGLAVSSKDRKSLFESISQNDIRKMLPRYSESENFTANVNVVNFLENLADDKGVSLSQLSLAWILAQAKLHKMTIIPIPGTSKPSHLKSNYQAGSIELSYDELTQINIFLDHNPIQGERWPANITFEKRPDSE